MRTKTVLVPTTFGIAIRAARFLRGLTLGELARLTGVPSARLRHFECGLARPAAEEFGIIWTVLRAEPPAVTS